MMLRRGLLKFAAMMFVGVGLAASQASVSVAQVVHVKVLASQSWPGAQSLGARHVPGMQFPFTQR